MISKKIWNESLTLGQRKRIVDILFEDRNSSYKETMAEKITDKLDTTHKDMLKAIKQVSPHKFEVSKTYLV